MKLQYILYLSFVLSLAFAQDAQWLNKTPMPTARSDLTANTVGDYIYVIGGCSSNQICPPGYGYCFCTQLTNVTEAYHPPTDTWSTLAEAPRPRYRHGAAVIGNKLYLIGGRDLTDAIIQQIDVYDIPSNTWTTIADLYNWANATSDLTVTTLGTKIYAIGGYDQNYVSMATTWVLDTAQQLPRWQGNVVPPMIQKRGDACAIGLDNKIYVFGGFSDTNFCAALGELEVYDPETNVWTKDASLRNPRGDSCCAIQHGKFHAIGGEVKDSENNCSIYDIPVNHVEYFDPVTGEWNEETAIPETRFRFAAAAWSNNFYVFGGQAAWTGDEYPVVNTVLAVQDNTPPDVGSATIVAGNMVLIVAALLIIL